MEQDVVNGTVADRPSDIKTVAYFVQAKRTDGCERSVSNRGGYSLKIFILGRCSWWFGKTLSRPSYHPFCIRAGHHRLAAENRRIIGSEVVAIEFEYFDGQLWQSNGIAAFKVCLW